MYGGFGDRLVTRASSKLYSAVSIYLPNDSTVGSQVFPPSAAPCSALYPSSSSGNMPGMSPEASARPRVCQTWSNPLATAGLTTPSKGSQKFGRPRSLVGRIQTNALSKRTTDTSRAWGPAVHVAGISDAPMRAVTISASGRSTTKFDTISVYLETLDCIESACV